MLALLSWRGRWRGLRRTAAAGAGHAGMGPDHAAGAPAGRTLLSSASDVARGQRVVAAGAPLRARWDSPAARAGRTATAWRDEAATRSPSCKPATRQRAGGWRARCPGLGAARITAWRRRPSPRPPRGRRRRGNWSRGPTPRPRGGRGEVRRGPGGVWRQAVLDEAAGTALRLGSASPRARQRWRRRQAL